MGTQGEDAQYTVYIFFYLHILEYRPLCYSRKTIPLFHKEIAHLTKVVQSSSYCQHNYRDGQNTLLLCQINVLHLLKAK